MNQTAPTISLFSITCNIKSEAYFLQYAYGLLWPSGVKKKNLEQKFIVRWFSALQKQFSALVISLQI
jgi:hypothetical protein